MEKNQKYVPLRRCMACNEQKEKKDLLRIVRNKEGILEIDLSGKKNGRGAYVCSNEECLKKLAKNRILNKAFKMQINEETYNQIMEKIIGQTKN